MLGRERAAKRAYAKVGGSRRCIAISTAAHHTRANGYTQGNGGLWRIHTTAHLPEGLQPMENSCQSRGNVRERRSSKEKPLLNDWTPVTLPNPSCCLGHGEKLSLGTGGGKVVLMFIFLFPTIQISSYISLHYIGNKVIFISIHKLSHSWSSYSVSLPSLWSRQAGFQFSLTHQEAARRCVKRTQHSWCITWNCTPR